MITPSILASFSWRTRKLMRRNSSIQIRIGLAIFVLEVRLLINFGVQGAVYRHPKNRKLAIKIRFHPAPEDERRYEAQMANPPAPLSTWGHPNFAWPLEIVFDLTTGVACGYVMPLIRRRPVPLKLVANPQSRIREIDQRWLLATATHFAWQIYIAQHAAYVVGDINLANALVNRHAKVSLVDVDSFQFRTSDGTFFPCPVGVGEFLPPELLGVPLASVERSPDQDAWMALTVIHRLLRQGTHPFDAQFVGKGKRLKLPARVKQGIWAESGQFPDYTPSPHSLPFQSLPPELQELFYRMFYCGHTDRGQRPTLADIVLCLEHIKKAGVWR